MTRQQRLPASAAALGVAPSVGAFAGVSHDFPKSGFAAQFLNDSEWEVTHEGSFRVLSRSSPTHEPRGCALPQQATVAAIQN